MFISPFQPETFPVKPAIENSLRILTAVIRGMRHWSQFKDKVPHLFEIFGQLMFFFSLVSSDLSINLRDCTCPTATLDSAVTLGRYGAKNFLMRDGKEVLQCVYYETVSFSAQNLELKGFYQNILLHIYKNYIT